MRRTRLRIGVRVAFRGISIAAPFMILAALLRTADAARHTPAQSDALIPGHIIERVSCKNSPDQVYALYVPSGYSSDRKWPLIAAFDPGARGRIPVEHFRDAAERYGFIICGSNNSRNGPIAPTAEAAKAMLGDVGSRFSIDDKRVYLTGFSGGARAATTLAVWLTGKIAGVIGCGAGFPEGLVPSASLLFVHYGTVGTEDFNYPEMKQLDRTLEQAHLVHHLAVFEGGHEWAPSDECVRAVEWIELQAMKSSIIPRQDGFLDRLFAAAQTRARADESAGRTLEAYLEYVAISCDFEGLRDITESKLKSDALRNSKSLKDAIARDREQETEQRRRVTEIFNLRANAQKWSTDPETQKPFLDDLKQIISDLKRKSESKEPSPERALARCVLNQFTVAASEQSMMLIQTKKYGFAVSNLVIDEKVLSDNWRVSYSLACAYALNGDKRQAIDALNRAVKRGFANANELESNHQLDSIRGESGFKNILESLKKH